MKHDAYIKETKGARQAVLMIHGICSTPRHFDWLIPEFDDSWSIYNILLDGHAGTVKDFANTSMKKWKAQVHAMLDDLCSRYDRVLLVGHSMGTLLSLEARPCYHNIAGLFLLNPPMRPRIRRRMIGRIIRLLRGKIRRDDPHEAVYEDHISIRLTSHLWQYLGWAPRFWELLMLCRYCRKHASHIHIPCHAFFGGLDEQVSLRSARYFQEQPFVTVHILEGAGHAYFPLEDQAEVLESLRRMLQGV